MPLTADVQLDLDQLDLGTLDPYLEPKLDLFILEQPARVARESQRAHAGKSIAGNHV